MSIPPAKLRNVPRQNLSAEQWAEAALDVMAAGGLEAVAVEPLAKVLGVTKGSFYWHFENREALIHAALDMWEKHETVDVIERAEQEGNPRERMHSLFRQVANTDLRSERLLLLLSATDHAAARACVQRVSEQWRTYVHDCYRALGLSESEARLWATFAYSTFMGTVRMRRDNPDALPAGPEFTQYLRFLIRSLIPRTDARDSDESHPAVVSLRRPRKA
jgi:AcrR family transcriptional regulator